MIQKIFSLAIILLILVGCENEPDVKEFPVITTLSPINLDETGVTFRGKLIVEGQNKATSYGFTWSTQDPNIKTTQKIVLGTVLQEGVFEARIDSLIAKGFEYKIRAFATYKDKTVYGNIVTFVSRGSKKTVWSRELSDVTFQGWGSPTGWSDGKNGYVVFQNSNVYKFDSEKKQFSKVANFPVSGSTGTSYTAVGINDIQYVLSNNDKKLYQLMNGAWSVKSDTPFYYGYFAGYYHGYSTLNKIFLLSSAQSFSYSPEINLWQIKAIMPTDRYSVGGTDLNGIAYVMDREKKIRKYDPQQNNWQDVTTFPGNLPNEKIIGFSHGNKLYFGFNYEGDDIVESIWSFNLSTNSWKEIETFPIDLTTGYVFYFFLNDKLYVGYGNSSNYEMFSLDTTKL